MDTEKVFKFNFQNISIKSPGGEAVQNLEGFSRQQQVYSAAIDEVRAKVETLRVKLKTKYGHNPVHHVECRLKTAESIAQKLDRRKLKVSLGSIWSNLTDVAGVRLICYYVDDIYHIANLILKDKDIKLLKQSDYIAHPKSNGYRSLHLVVGVPVFIFGVKRLVPAEIQIRTIAMDFWASLEHQLEYKTGSAAFGNLRQRLKNCAESIFDIDLEMQSIYKDIKGKGADKA